VSDFERRLAGIQWGDHLCLMYVDATEALDTVGYYFEDGYRRGERCYYVGSGVDSRIAEALDTSGFDASRALAEQRLILLDPGEVFGDSCAETAALSGVVRRMLDTESAAHGRGVRLALDMEWALAAGLGAEAIRAFESSLNRFIRGASGSVLCLFNRRRFPPALLRDLLALHPTAVARDMVLPNVYYIPPEIESGVSGASDVLDWRLEQLWRLRMTEEDLWNTRAELVARDRAVRVDSVGSRGMAFLAEAGRVLASSLDHEVTLDRLARLAVREMADFAIIDLVEGGEVRRVAAAHRDPERQELMTRLLEYPPGLDRPDGISQVIRTGKPVLLREVNAARHRAVAQDLQHLLLIRELAGRSVVVAPLRTRGETFGAITLGSCRRQFGPADLALAEELASRAALAVENARLYHEAKAAIRRRDEVVAIISHDLRNPVGAIHTVAELLKSTPVPTRDLRKHAGLIASAAKSALTLIEDLLDISRIESGALGKGDVRPCQLPQLVREVCELFEPYAREKRLKLAWAVDEHLPAVMADPDRLSQVLANLIGNAVKFTETGQVVVQVRRNGDQVEVSVADSGPGLTEEERQHMFDRFWQAVKKQRAGAGLGLAICKGIVEGYGGRIWADSQVGRGSTFRFTIPIGQS